MAARLVRKKNRFIDASAGGWGCATVTLSPRAKLIVLFTGLEPEREGYPRARHSEVPHTAYFGCGFH